MTTRQFALFIGTFTGHLARWNTWPPTGLLTSLFPQKWCLSSS